MNCWKAFWAPLLTLSLGLTTSSARAEGEGQADLDEALRVKVTAENLRDLNKTIELLESAIEKGLDVENSDFAEGMLVESLIERAGQLAGVVQSVPMQRLVDPSIQKVRGLAVSDLRRVLEYDDAPPHAKMLLAQLLTLPGGDRPEALKLLDDMFDDKGIEELPAKMRAEALTLRATLQTDPEKALADYNAAIELEPGDMDHRMARADFQRQQGKLDEAIADIDAWIEKNPDQANAYVTKAQVLRDQKKMDEAIAALDKATELAPTAPGPYQQRGEIYREQGEFAKAIEQFNKVLQMQPGLTLTLVHRAEAYLNNKQFDEALVDIESVLKANPDFTPARGLRAQALASLERWPEAIKEMKSLAKEQPEQPEFQLQLAAYFVLAKQPQAAIREYTEILEGDENNFAALEGRANAYLTIGEHAPALADFEKAYKSEPEDTRVLNNLAWLLATSPEDAVRDGKRAIELATKACELEDYKQAHILSTLAAAYAETGDFENARRWSQKAVDMNDPEHAKQLAEELASYKEEKPWRERQTLEESKAPSDKAAEEAPAEKADDPPATANAPANPVNL
jgi:tetratricopeptide (TPR) repeat protein